MHTLRELANAAGHGRCLGEREAQALDAIVPQGERRVLTWRHNLDIGARPVLVGDGDVRSACVKLAIDAASAIGIAFASIDVVRADGAWQVLEINSGVMMEALAKLYPDLVQATYGAALDRVFGESGD